ncbi:hypothetical protein MRB53_040107 [Persea americana]|nr:hypothetical protein MRB53_040107 [Persea americana]
MQDVRFDPDARFRTGRHLDCEVDLGELGLIEQRQSLAAKIDMNDTLRIATRTEVPVRAGPAEHVAESCGPMGRFRLCVTLN